jgi:hypothetical protein
LIAGASGGLRPGKTTVVAPPVSSLIPINQSLRQQGPVRVTFSDALDGLPESTRKRPATAQGRFVLCDAQ